MLNLTQKLGVPIRIGDSITVTITGIRSDGSVTLAIDAPREVPIHRKPERAVCSNPADPLKYAQHAAH